MPKTKRDHLKYEMGKAYHNIDRALGNVQVLHGEFQKAHPKHTEFLEAIASNLLFTQDVIRRFCSFTWGMLPKSIRESVERDASSP